MSCLAPDAATLISRGDGLVLTVHTTQPERAITLRKNTQNQLRAKWAQVMSETEVGGLRVAFLVKSLSNSSMDLFKIKLLVLLVKIKGC